MARASSESGRRHLHRAWLVAILLAVVGGFVSIRFLAQQASSEVDTAADQIIAISNPAIQALASMRASVFQLELLLAEPSEDGQLPDLEELEAALTRLGDDVQRYLALPALPGERDQREVLQQRHLRFQRQVVRAQELLSLDRAAEAGAVFRQGVLPAGGALLDSAMDQIARHAQYSSRLAMEAQAARRRGLVLGNVLTAFYSLLILGGGALVYREFRRRRALAEERAAFHEARAAELEQFAGRVAHDIRSPLSGAKLGAELLQRRAGDEQVRGLAERVLRSLSRANAIVDGLFEFARSGAHPDPGARTDVREGVAETVASLAADAQRAGITLDAAAPPPVLVACSRGIYLSLLGNLVRNALKYMGDAPARRVGIRVVEEGDQVRTEVIDTGPGIRPELLGSLFQPYFRANQDVRKDGLGLGLATVRRLSESHGGAAGVRSALGEGSTFWFTLPRAGVAPPQLASDPAPPAVDSGAL